VDGRALALAHQDSLVLQGLRATGPATAYWIKRGGSNADSEGGTFRDAITNGFDLTLASNCMDGASPVPWLAVQEGALRGLYVGWEFSGLGRIRAQAQHDGLELRVGNHPDFKTDLKSVCRDLSCRRGSGLGARHPGPGLSIIVG
jgi:hypothetical protein